MKKINEKILLPTLTIIFVMSIILCLPQIQDLLLVLAEKLKGAPPEYPQIWTRRLMLWSFILVVVTFLCLFKNKISTKNQNIATIVILFVSAFAASIRFSAYPFSNCEPITDSSVFIYIGQMMHRGFVPYVDMFDHKGLYLYFLEFLATTANSFAGIYFLELFSIFISLYFVYKIGNLFCNNNSFSLIATILIFVIFGEAVIAGENLCEGYALSCVSVSVYYFFKFLKNNEVLFKEFFIIGFLFTVVLFLKVNNVSPWVFFVPYTIVILLKSKNYKQLKIAVLAMIAGVATAFIPIAIYLTSTDSWQSMWESYILFNFEYIENRGFVTAQVGKFLTALFFIKILIIPNIFMIVAVIFNRKDKLFIINLLAYLFTLFFIVISGRIYCHYGMILLPFFAYPIVCVLGKLSEKMSVLEIEKISFSNNIFGFGLIIFAVCFLYGSVSISRLYPKENSAVNYLKTNTKPTDEVLVLGNFVKYNVLSNRYSKQRLFFQGQTLIVNNKLCNDFKNGLANNPPDYVVFPKKLEESDFMQYQLWLEIVSNLLENYDVVFADEDKIYKKRE